MKTILALLIGSVILVLPEVAVGQETLVGLRGLAPNVDLFMPIGQWPADRKAGVRNLVEHELRQAGIPVFEKTKEGIAELWVATLVFAPQGACYIAVYALVLDRDDPKERADLAGRRVLWPRNTDGYVYTRLPYNYTEPEDGDETWCWQNLQRQVVLRVRQLVADYSAVNPVTPLDHQ